jgi:hypothetical protein
VRERGAAVGEREKKTEEKRRKKRRDGRKEDGGRPRGEDTREG